jgi:hypothetical protein
MRHWIRLEFITLIALGIYLFLKPSTEFTFVDTLIVVVSVIWFVLSLLKVMLNKKE